MIKPTSMGSHSVPVKISLLDRALERLSEDPRFDPPAIGLTCCFCRSFGVQPLGSRIYICRNPDCSGAPTGTAPHSMALVVDAVHGAHLVPWEEAIARDRIRKTDPRALLPGLRLVR